MQSEIGSHTPDLASLIAPVKPGDSLAFNQLAKTYNFANTSNVRATFTRLAIDECRQRSRPIAALDIGCGRGIGRRFEYVRAIREHVDEFWGIEPDANVKPADGIFDHFETAILETATLPDNHFDLAYAYMVMEHVPQPRAFMQVAARVLKPGGVFLFATPNSRHYFTLIAKTAHTLKIDEVILRLVHGKAKKEDYHYPVKYLFNSERQIAIASQDLGLRQPECIYLEPEGPKGYLPGPLRPVLHVMNCKRRVIRNPRTLATIIGRITKAT